MLVRHIWGEKMNGYGIMQGRLTPSNGRGIQFFPFDNWKEEFYLAAKIGLQEIEWIFDYDRYIDNPIWDEEGRQEVKSVISETGIKVNSVCFDYFMRRPCYKYQNDEKRQIYKENCDLVHRVINALAEIGGNLLEIPMVDNSSLNSAAEYELAIKFIEDIAAYAERYNIQIGLETDLPPAKFVDFLEKIAFHYIYANFDSGNSSGIGYNPNEEIPKLGERIRNVHIKDRIYHGTTVALGTGSADFDAVFDNLGKIGYKGSLILQAARGKDGFEAETAERQLKFVKAYAEKYGL